MATPTSGEITWTAADISTKTGLSPDKVQQAVKEQLVTPVSRGRYSPFPTLVGLIKFLDAQLGRPLTVNKDELREITGLSDQRHRQLANEGLIPPAIRGRWQVWECAKGVINHYRLLHARRDKTLSELRQRKLLNENELMEMTKAEKRQQLVSVDDMESHLRPFLVGARQRILGSSMTRDEKDEILLDLGGILKHALAKQHRNTSAQASPDILPAAEVDGQ